MSAEVSQLRTLYRLMSDPGHVYVVTDGGIRWLADRRVLTADPIVRDVFEGLPDGIYKLSASKPPRPVPESGDLRLPALGTTAAGIEQREDWIPATQLQPPILINDEIHGLVVVLESGGMPVAVRHHVHDAWCAYLSRARDSHVTIDVTAEGLMVRYGREMTWGRYSERNVAFVPAVASVDVADMFRALVGRWNAASRERAA
jgi:hypothetical protein